MSRLDSFIRRIVAQKKCLEQCAAAIGQTKGPVVELGLGNGRTFDHLRELLPDREIFVFERRPNAHAASTPDAAHLIEGDLALTLPKAQSLLPARAALLHSDIGCGDAAIDARTAPLNAENLARVMASRGVVLSDQPLTHARLEPIALPEDVEEGRYFIYEWSA